MDLLENNNPSIVINSIRYLELVVLEVYARISIKVFNISIFHVVGGVSRYSISCLLQISWN